MRELRILYVAVAPRKRRVSRNYRGLNIDQKNDVAPRMGRVSRNHAAGARARKKKVAPHMGRVSRNLITVR